MIRAIIVDDERPSIEKMAKLLENSGMVVVEGKFTKPLEALEFLKENKLDVIFLDIEMPDMNGIEMSSRIIDLQEEAAIVFVTAYNQYAVEAFRLNAMDYLMKPVLANRLKETLCKIVEQKGIRVDPSGIFFRCFGRFKVSNSIQEVKFRTEKAEELLSFMIDKRGNFVSRSEIIDSLWVDFDGERAITHLNTTLHYVKKALLQYGIRIPFTYDRGGYQFDMEGFNCDYLKFCTFIEKEKVPVQENILKFEETAGLFIGEYLSGCEYDWASVKRLLLEEQFFTMILEMTEYYKIDASYHKAAKWLKAALIMEPLHRELNYKIIEILLLTNERALAARYYDIYKNGLKKRLGVDPDMFFQKLIE